MRDKKRVKGNIYGVHLGKEDHGILTCSISIEFEGYHQSFGNIYLDNKDEAKQFVDSLCSTFSVRKLEDLKGLTCYGLYCFSHHNTIIEGLEAENGSKFTLTDFRIAVHGKASVPTPLETAKTRYTNDIASLSRRIERYKECLKTLDKEYTPWSNYELRKKK